MSNEQIPGTYFPLIYREETPVEPVANRFLRRVPFLASFIHGSDEYRTLKKFLDRLNQDVGTGQLSELNLQKGKWTIGFYRIRRNTSIIEILDNSSQALSSRTLYHLHANKVRKGTVSIEIRKENLVDSLSGKGFLNLVIPSF